MPTRNATATWEGGLKGGKGNFSGESGAIGGQYSFGSRFEQGTASNPEALLAAAQAGGFSLALAAAFERAGTPATSVETNAAATVEKAGEGMAITTMKLHVRASVPNVDDETFRQKLAETKQACIVTRALGGIKNIEVDGELV